MAFSLRCKMEKSNRVFQLYHDIVLKTVRNINLSRDSRKYSVRVRNGPEGRRAIYNQKLLGFQLRNSQKCPLEMFVTFMHETS